MHQRLFLLRYAKKYIIIHFLGQVIIIYACSFLLCLFLSVNPPLEEGSNAIRKNDLD